MRQGLAEEGQLALRAGDEPISGFRLVRRRGRGGFGEVWEAEASGGIHVALKFVRCSPRALASELRALNFVRGIHHPNILANFGSWQVDGVVIVGMELADGSLWDRYVEAANAGLRGIPRSELLGYMADAAGAVDFLNEPRHTVDGRGGMGVQHRDIKPPNILLFGGGAKVADLGMARAMEGENAGHTGIWTFSYAAPEFFRGVTSRQSDQYGLAATYCHLRSGRLPYEGNAASVTAGHLFGNPDLEDLPEAERPVLERALAKEPADRWPDCRSFVEALRAIAPERAPERLLAPEDTAERPPRMHLSTTGSSFIPGGLDDDAPSPSWRPFGSGEGVDSLMDTSEVTPPTSGGTGPTAIAPAAAPEFENLFPEPPRPRRIGRYAASVALVGLAVAAAGVHPLADHGRNPRPTAPDVAVVAPVPRMPEVVEGPTPSEAETILEPEVEPAPAEAAETIRPDPTPSLPAEPDPPADAGATRSDLIPGPRARRDPPADRPEPARPSPTEVAPAVAARGRDHLAQGDYEPAIADFDELIRICPTLASAYFYRAVARHRASHYPEALADYSEAIRLRPGNPFSLVARGQAHHDLGAYDRAIADFTEAIRLRPDDASIRLRRGLARYRSDDFAGALADFDETLRLDPKDARAREFRGDTLARLGGRARPEPGKATPKPPPPASTMLPPR